MLGRHRRCRASGRRALCGADQGGREGEAAAGRPRDPDRRRRILRPREGHGRGEDHARRTTSTTSRSASGTGSSRSTCSTIARSSTTMHLPAYRGLDRFEARKRVVADLDALGLLEKIEPTTHTVPHGDRSNVVIEPWLTDQWYVNAAELAKPAIAAVEHGKTVVRAEELGEDLLRVDAQHPAVVHLAPALVGPSDSGVVRAGRARVRRRRRGDSASACRRALRQAPHR